jgi:Uma2 family endonuclease
MTAVLEQLEIDTSLSTKLSESESIRALIDESKERYEIINGQKVVMPPATPKHGLICINLSSRLHQYVNSTSPSMGFIFNSSTMFRTSKGNMRIPDVSFVSRERVNPDFSIEGTPDLAIEVISPNNTFGEMHDKLVEYFESGTKLAWLIHSEEEFALVYHSANEPSALIKKGEILSGETVVAGFSVTLQDIFPKLGT